MNASHEAVDIFHVDGSKESGDVGLLQKAGCIEKDITVLTLSNKYNQPPNFLCYMVSSLVLFYATQIIKEFRPTWHPAVLLQLVQ